MAEMKIITFKEDDFDLEQLKKEADLHAKAIAKAKRTRVRYNVARYIIIISLFIIGYCLYFFASDLIARHDYNKYHTTGYLDRD